jgi:predicted polyphosphate/ATP-dependent NAD kinase
MTLSFHGSRQFYRKMKIGLLINPLAGIGGAVALKGSDGAAIVDEAFARGAHPQAAQRALEALRHIGDGIALPVFTVGGDMGEAVLEKLGLVVQVVYQPAASITAAEDTRRAAAALCAHGIDLLLFAGGDGTARDVLDGLEAVGCAGTQTVIGIPAGCKIHSAVYAVNPQQAGELVAQLAQARLLSVRQAEVMDLDEDAFRNGQVRARCYGYLSVPFDENHMQSMKQGGLDHEALAQQDIAVDVVENMDTDTLYLVGSGTTTAAVMQALGLDNTLLGIDAVRNGEVIAADLDERAILSLLDEAGQGGYGVKIIVTAIGGQGHVFGRGNQPFSAAVIRRIGRENIVIIATREKLRSLQGRPLRLDTGDSALDQELAGMTQVVTGFEQRTLYRLG